MNKGQSKAKNLTEGKKKKKNGDYSAYQTEETVGNESTMGSFQLREFLQLY